MNNFAAFLIVFALFSISSDWQLSSNVMVQAGRMISIRDCMGTNCLLNTPCPPGCRCPNVIHQQLFGNFMCY
ncbi:hypothetical protein MTO96_030040 [Rhipicephalus appendiculatus]